MAYRVIGTTIVDTSRNVTVASLGVNTTASGTPGEIRATNNITAYFSDDRLKNKLKPITNALASIETLNGFYFTNNDIAGSFGYETSSVQIGLSAQAVQKQFPEIVTNAPFDSDFTEDGTIFSISGENYLTVDYAKLVPVLIEAIKELKAEIDTLKNTN